MKNLLSILFVTLFAFSLSAQTNPALEYWTTKRWKAKDGQGQDFVKAAAAKTKMFNMTPENPMVSYRILDGPDQGMIERIYPALTLDKVYNRDNSAGRAHWMDNVQQHVASSEGVETWWRIKNLCNNWVEGGKPATHLSVETIVVENGKLENVRRYLNRASKIRAAHSTVGIAVFKISSGGQNNKFRIVTFFDDPMKALGEWKSDKTFDEEYDAMFGYNAMQTDRRAYNESLLPWAKITERLQLIPEMSFMGQ